MVLKVRRKCAMTCDEFEAIGWDAQGSASSTDAQRAAAAEHAVSCARCGALRNSWEATRLELRSLAQLTTSVEAPARVELRLRPQFRTEYHTPKAIGRASCRVCVSSYVVAV